MSATAAKWLKFRIFTVGVFFLVLFIALISRAFHLQVLSNETLKILADKQHLQTLAVHSERGIIFDRNGEKLAASVMSDSVCADPAKIKNPVSAARKLNSIVGGDVRALGKKLATDKNFCWIARRIAPHEAQKVADQEIDGVFLIKEPKRFYPSGGLAGRLIGFVGADSVGLEGLELRYEDYLRGEPEKLTWARDAKGRKLYPRIDDTLVKHEDNANLILTIDSRIQHLVESKLLEAIKDKGAKGGFAIVMDPKTGEILALADEPGFDPNNFSSYAIGKGKNKAITDCFDPGSTFKPFLVAAALQEGVASETTRFNCENGQYRIADRVIREANRKKHGTLTLHDILKYSSNIGSVKIYERLGKDKFYDYIRKFGFGQKTGIDLPGESQGLLRPKEKWTRIDGSTIAFGQGISVTAIQLITALSAVANDGMLMKPYVVRGFVNKKGQIIKVMRPTPVRQVVSAKTAKRLTAILTDVVGEEDGTGKKAHIQNITVAGKTGTSQKFDFSRGVYSSERVRTSFMGFFPADNPKIAMLITLDEPQRDRWGGVAAAPVFKNIGEQILTCFKTDIHDNQAPVIQEPPAVPPMNVRLAAMKTVVKEEAQDLDENGDPRMPDFHGMTIREVLKRSRNLGIDVKVNGSGWAVSQDPAPGVVIGDYKTCLVSFKSSR